MPGARRTEYQRDRILGDFADGRSLREIAGFYGCKNNYPVKLAERAGWPPRPKIFEGAARDIWKACVARMLKGKTPVVIVVLCALTAVLLAARGSKPISEQPISVASAAPVAVTVVTKRFEERWPVQPKKADLLSPVPMAPIMVKTERVLMETQDVRQQTDEPGETVPLPVSRPSKPKARSHTVARDGICTRHGMHKVYTRGGRSWRCRR